MTVSSWMKNIVNGKAYILTTLIQINNLVIQKTLIPKKDWRFNYRDFSQQSPRWLKLQTIQKTEENTSVTFLYETVSGLSGCRLVVIKIRVWNPCKPKGFRLFVVIPSPQFHIFFLMWNYGKIGVLYFLYLPKHLIFLVLFR